MNTEEMTLEALQNHLIRCHPDILKPPEIKKGDGGVHTAAIISDTLDILDCGRINTKEAQSFMELVV